MAKKLLINYVLEYLLFAVFPFPFFKVPNWTFTRLGFRCEVSNVLFYYALAHPKDRQNGNGNDNGNGNGNGNGNCNGNGNGNGNGNT